MQKIKELTYPNTIAENANIDKKYKSRAEKFAEIMLEEFFEFCKIPHPSGHVEQMRKYLYDWGNSHNLQTTLDDSGCIYIDLPATEKCKDYPTIIFQAHYDMVAVAAKTNKTYVKTETPIVPFLDKENNCVHTKWHTSLGADNGCGITTCLAMARLHLDKNFEFEHGPIRFLFTYDEETTFQGVVHLSQEAINSDYLINLDSIYTGLLISSSAGAMSATISKRIQTMNAGSKGQVFSLNIWGLNGGHSGEDINKNRCSTSIFLGKLLEIFNRESINFNFKTLDCGTLMNAIPSKLVLKLIMGSKDIEKATKITEDLINNAKKQYVDGPDLQYEISSEPAFATPMLSISDSIKIWHLIKNMPNGVIKTFDDGKPYTSNNIGHIVIDKGSFQLDFLFRSVDMQTIDRTNELLTRRSKEFRMDYTLHGRFPSWPKLENNKLNDLFLEAYSDVCGFEGSVVDIHSGLECGYLHDKYPSLIMTSIGCDIINEHTRKETLYTKSLPAHFASILYVIENFNKVNE